MEIVFRKTYTITVPSWKDFNVEIQYLLHITSDYEGKDLLVINKDGYEKKGFAIIDINLESAKLIDQINKLEYEYLQEPLEITLEERLLSKTFLFKLKELFIEFKGRSKVLLNVQKNGKNYKQLELKTQFVDASNEELLKKVMDAIEYASIVDDVTTYDDEAPF